MAEMEDVQYVTASVGRRIRLVVSWFFMAFFIWQLWLAAVLWPAIAWLLICLVLRLDLNAPNAGEKIYEIPRDKKLAKLLRGILLFGILAIWFYTLLARSYMDTAEPVFDPMVSTTTIVIQPDLTFRTVVASLLMLVFISFVLLDLLEINGRIKLKHFPEPKRPPECGSCGITLRPGATQCHWCGGKPRIMEKDTQ